jgi:hypothetical protein
MRVNLSVPAVTVMTAAAINQLADDLGRSA